MNKQKTRVRNKGNKVTETKSNALLAFDIKSKR